MKIKLMFVLPFVMVVLLGCAIIEHIGEPRYFALSISSDEPVSVYNLNRYAIWFCSGSETESNTTIMAEAGDLLYITTEEIELFYRFDPKDGQHLSFTSDPDAPYMTYLNGQLVCLGINDDPGVWEWIKECDIRSLQHLQSLDFSGGLGEILDLNLVKKIAKARPTIGLCLGDITKVSSEILALFTPSWLYISGSFDFNEVDTSRLKKLECLFVFEPENTQFIEELDHLETLILHSENDAGDLNLDRIAQLRSLTLSGWSNINGLENFSNRNRLRNLYFVGCETDDVSLIYLFPKLTGLGLYYCDVDIDLLELQDLSRLRWLSFPPNVSQSDFATFLSQHPELKVVDLINCDKINDLSPLASLAEIQGLTLEVAVEDLSPLYQLTDLQVLTLGEDSFDEEDYQNLQASLPNTQIVTGYCLGSGWLLLMIPCIAVGSVVIHLARKRSSR